MSDRENLAFWLGQLRSPDPKARVRSLQAIAERPIPDPTLLAECEALLDDREICLVQIPLRFGEVRVAAVGAVAALRHVLEIETPVVVERAFFPLTVDRIGQLARVAGIDSNLSGADGTIDKLRQLRAAGHVPTLTIRREPREMEVHTQRVMRENQEKRLARIAIAKAELPPGKEPLDVSFVKHNARTGALGKLSDEELVVKLEDLYYVDHPSYRTNQQLVDLLQLLGDYE